MFREESRVPMQRVNEYRFYELGQKIQAIKGIQAATKYEDVWYLLWDARLALHRLKSDAVALRISRAVVDAVIQAISKIVPEDSKEAAVKMVQKEGEPPATVGWAYYLLSEALGQLEPVLAAECSALDTYVVSQKRVYSTSDLVDRADIMLSEEAIDFLPHGVLKDIRAAGRCLAFDIPTASGFHVLRAVEAVMSLYFTHLTAKELPKQNRNWGLYLKELKKAPNHDPKVWGALDHIRDNYRNPISHPEDTLTEGEAIMLFGLCLSSVELMVLFLRGTPPALSEADQLKALAVIAAQDEPDQLNF